MSYSNSSRRNFLKKTGLVTAAFTILPNNVISGLGKKAPSDKLNIAGIGIGGKGHVNLKDGYREHCRVM